MKKKYGLAYIISFIDMIFCGLLMYILYYWLPSDIWIISERLDQAQDNGLAFFEYLNERHPEINSYYLLNKGCNKISKVSKIGRVITKNSLRHKLYFLKSCVVLSTEKNMIEPWGSNIFYKYFSRVYPNKIKVFLQHGILDKDISHIYGKKVSNIDIFVTSSKAERDFVIEKFGYLSSEISNTGISRYDKLIEDSTQKRNLILYMPTWRRYLINLGINNKIYIDKMKSSFLKSDYYREIDNLLHSNVLYNLLEENDYEFIMIGHHAMNELINEFKVSNKKIKIYKSEEVEIRKMIKSAKIFITDYSSTHFDSAYVGNINLYYQFDKYQFIEEHAGESYFNYEEQGFGKISTNLEELLQQIKKSIERDGCREGIFSKRVEDFFEFDDGRNSERLYYLLRKKLINKGKSI